MMDLVVLAGSLLALLGSFILFSSGLGVIRMPDVWNRMHAGTKATTLGSILFLIGLGLLRPSWIPRLLLVVLFVLLTNPVSSHALARAVYGRSDEKPDNLVEDEMTDGEDER